MFNSFKCYALFVLTAGDVEDLNFYIKGDYMRVQFLIKKWTHYYSSVNSLNGALYNLSYDSVQHTLSLISNIYLFIIFIF